MKIFNKILSILFVLGFGACLHGMEGDSAQELCYRYRVLSKIMAELAKRPEFENGGVKVQSKRVREDKDTGNDIWADVQIYYTKDVLTDCSKSYAQEHENDDGVLRMKEIEALCSTLGMEAQLAEIKKEVREELSHGQSNKGLPESSEDSKTDNPENDNNSSRDEIDNVASKFKKLFLANSGKTASIILAGGAAVGIIGYVGYKIYKKKKAQNKNVNLMK